MGTLTAELRDFLDSHVVGVLGTTAPSGKPRQSLVYFVRDGDQLLISTLADRLKAQDVRRSAWASLCVMGHDPPYPSASFSGSAQVLIENIGVPTAMLMQRIAGAPEPPAPISDAELAALGRVIVSIRVERVTAANYIEAAATAR